MRFTISHLLILTAFVFFGLVGMDRSVTGTATVEFKLLDAPPNIKEFNFGKGYALNFSIHYHQSLTEGIVGDEFGHNQLLNFVVDANNVDQLDNRKVVIRYRKHSVLWLPATSVEEQLANNFRSFLIFPVSAEP